MLEEKIETLKEKLNDLIERDAPYIEVYNLSREIDGYIAQYYREREVEEKWIRYVNKSNRYENNGCFIFTKFLYFFRKKLAIVRYIY